MLTDNDILRLNRSRFRVLIPTMALAVAAMLGYFALLSLVREPIIALVRSVAGGTAANITPIALILPALGIFLIPCIIAEKSSKRFALLCPDCSADITRRTNRVLATRCCPSCGSQVVAGGRIRGPSVYDRYVKLKTRRFLVYWLWTWPVLGALTIAWYSIAPLGLSRCLHVLFVPSLIGTVASGWSYLRTTDRRYLPQFFASAILLFVGAFAYWNADW